MCPGLNQISNKEKADALESKLLSVLTDAWAGKNICLTETATKKIVGVETSKQLLSRKEQMANKL